MSKVAGRSWRIKREEEPASAAIRRSLVTWTRAVSVLCEEPDCRVRFILVVMRELMAERFDLIIVVGRGSRRWVDGVIFLIMACISLYSNFMGNSGEYSCNNNF